MTLALALLVGLLLGVLLGRWFSLRAVHVPAMEPAPPPVRRRIGESRYLEEADQLVRAVVEDGHEPLTSAVCSLADEAFADGVNALRAQLVHTSGLPEGLMDSFCTHALRGLRGPRGVE